MHSASIFKERPSRPRVPVPDDSEGEGTASSFYLATALSIGTAPPFKTETLSPSRVTSASFEKRSVVILNDTTPLSTAADDALKRFVNQGGGLLIVTGEHVPWNAATPLMPGKVGAPVERLLGGGGTIGTIDYSHPVFEEFKDPRNGNFTTVRFFKYRLFTPSPTDKVLARYDDGAPAVVEWAVGSGRVMLTASTVDKGWNDFPDEVPVPAARAQGRELSRPVSGAGLLVHRRPLARRVGADRGDRA
jgi:hypothetical protein